MNIKTQIHTIFIIIDKQNVFSDTLSKKLNKPFNVSKNFKLGIEILHMDNELFYSKLDTLSTYPYNTEFIIIEAPSLTDTLINSVNEISTKNHYNVDVVMVDKTDLMDLVNIKNIHYIDQPVENIDIIDLDEYTSRIIPTKYDWITIGDVHGCIGELKELLISYGFEIDGLAIKDTDKTKQLGLVFVGDLIDKSSDADLEETIRFFHYNMNIMGDRFHMVMGNHEDMVWRWVTNDPTIEITPARLDQKVRYYKTTFLLEENAELYQLFMDIFNRMKGWIKYIGNNKRSFVVTHAPCEIKYLEKMDKTAFGAQLKCASRSRNRDKSNDELTPYLMIEANENHPIHIFGHMGQTNLRIFKNKVCVDTGCVYGFELTGYMYLNNNHQSHTIISKIKLQAKNDFSNNLFNIND